METALMARKKRKSRKVKDAELARKKYLYRRLAMDEEGRKLPARLAMKLVGPDCAYHLYRHK